jgi:hypothetical protein
MKISYNRTASENIVFPAVVLKATYGTDGIRSFRQCIFDLIES